jgi:hypothetical protein
MSNDQKVLAIMNIVASYVGLGISEQKASYCKAHFSLQKVGVECKSASKILAEADVFASRRLTPKH